MLLKKSGFDFSFNPKLCSECEGDCCIGESGFIWINLDEIETLANYLNLSTKEVREKFLIKIKYRYSIKEIELSENNYACIFFDLEQKHCSIYEVRPKQCKDFPFWDYFKDKKEEVKEECPAIE